MQKETMKIKLNLLSKLLSGTIIGLICSSPLLAADLLTSYVLSISLEISGFTFLIVRFLILLSFAGVLSIPFMRVFSSIDVWLPLTACSLAYYYIFVVIRVYSSHTFDRYTLLTDPLSASFLPMVIGLVGGYKIYNWQPTGSGLSSCLARFSMQEGKE